MEDTKQQFKVNLSQGALKIESSHALTAEQIQPFVDATILQQKAHLQHEKDIDTQHQIYTLMIAALISLGLFTVSFAVVRTVSKTLKKSEVVHYVG